MSINIWCNITIGINLSFSLHLQPYLFKTLTLWVKNYLLHRIMPDTI